MWSYFIPHNSSKSYVHENKICLCAKKKREFQIQWFSFSGKRCHRFSVYTHVTRYAWIQCEKETFTLEKYNSSEQILSQHAEKVYLRDGPVHTANHAHRHSRKCPCNMTFARKLSKICTKPEKLCICGSSPLIPRGQGEADLWSRICVKDFKINWSCRCFSAKWLTCFCGMWTLKVEKENCFLFKFHITQCATWPQKRWICISSTKFFVNCSRSHRSALVLLTSRDFVEIGRDYVLQSNALYGTSCDSLRGYFFNFDTKTLRERIMRELYN